MTLVIELSITIYYTQGICRIIARPSVAN